MAYQVPDDYRKLRKVKINRYLAEKNWFETRVEQIFLGQIELFGYYNRIGAKKRIGAAIVQTIWSSGILIGIAAALRWLNESLFSAPVSVVHALALVAAIFGAAFYREMKDIHNKWDYLAKTFNDVIKLPSESKSQSDEATVPYSQRDHLGACLAHDILTMGMWGHRSFRSFFLEVLEKAVALKIQHPEKIQSQLEGIAASGIDFSLADEWISEYIESVRPKTDLPKLRSVPAAG